MASRASLQYSLFVGVILSLFILLLLIVAFLNPLKDVFLNIYSDSSCNSFFKTKNLFSKFSVNIPFSTSENFCAPTFIKVKKSADDNEIKSVIANSMINCWNNYGRGSVELFSERGSNFYCVLCSYISFEDKNKNIVGFKDFLINNYVPYTKYSDYTYMEFLSNCDLEKCDGDFYYFSSDEKANTITSLNQDFDINTNNDYAVLYLTYEKNAFLKNIDALKISSTAAVISVVVLSVTGGAPLIIYGLVATATAVTSGTVALKYASKDPYWVSGVTVVPYDQNTLKSLNCENIDNINSNI